MSQLSDKRLQQTEQYCQQAQLKLTPIRKTILEIIYREHQYYTAYEILDLLCQTQPKMKSMTVYRALNYLEAHHLIHKLPSKNAFVACESPGKDHQAKLLHCEDCKTTKEIFQSPLNSLINELGDDYHFALSNAPIELRGTCHRCQNT